MSLSVYAKSITERNWKEKTEVLREEEEVRVARLLLDRSALETDALGDLRMRRGTWDISSSPLVPLEPLDPLDPLGTLDSMTLASRLTLGESVSMACPADVGLGCDWQSLERSASSGGDGSEC